MNKNLTIRNSTAEFLIFTTSNGQDTIEVKVEDETVWLTQKLMAKLFDVNIATINEHLKNIFKTHELEENSVVRKFLITASDGKNYNTKHYNLEAIISLGYRINSKKGTEFRRWATQVLKTFTTRGYVLDNERLKNGSYLNPQYYKDLILEIRDIRESERNFYQQITDIYATALDYDLQAPTTQEFFATVQNKLHWAIHGHTASELIVQRANHKKEFMGLTNLEKAPNAKKLASANLDKRAKELIEIIKQNPFQNPPPYEKLVAHLNGSYLRRINIQHRLVYEVREEDKVVRISRMWSHYE